MKKLREIRIGIRKKNLSEEKILIVSEGLQGEDSIAELCGIKCIRQNLYQNRSKAFTDAGNSRLTGDPKRKRLTSQLM